VNTGAPWPGLVEAERRVRMMQAKLHQWAKADPDRRFDDLHNLVYDPAFLVVAWSRVRTNKGARTAGVDGVAPRAVGSGAGRLLCQVRAALKAGRFVPQRVREKTIPKASGKLRRLGIATTADRVVQASLKLVLEPIFEADFHPCSYGFRPGRRAQDAIAEIHHLASPNRNYEWVLEADITACLDPASHCPLGAGEGVEQPAVGLGNLDTQALSPARPHMDSAELAALDTLQHRLPRHPQRHGGLQHRQPALGGLLDEPAAQLVGDPDPPRRTRGGLLTGDEPVGQPPVHRRGRHVEQLGGLGDGDQLASGGVVGGW
jgi:hypothetical protein